jgi:hypothetical protein
MAGQSHHPGSIRPFPFWPRQFLPPAQTMIFKLIPDFLVFEPLNSQFETFFSQLKTFFLPFETLKSSSNPSF